MAEKPKIRCGDSDCDNKLHCYQEARRIAAKKTVSTNQASPVTSSATVVSNDGQSGTGEPQLQGRRCRDCGVALVDWDRTKRRDISDVNYTFDALKTELIRHSYWHKSFGPRAVNYATRKGLKGVRIAMENRLRKAVGVSIPYRDGRQTPYGDDDVGSNVLYFAQHATATCCRKCAETWHGIEQGRDLNDGEVAYLTDLCMRFVSDRLPHLKENGVSVPSIRKRQPRKKEK